jgi:hypothetical protein
MDLSSIVDPASRSGLRMEWLPARHMLPCARTGRCGLAELQDYGLVVSVEGQFKERETYTTSG